MFERIDIHKRFWLYVDKSGECWKWNGCTNNTGYGTIRNHDGTTLAHRTAWEITHGAIPDDLCVLHTCDNPLCVRPDHLMLGTQTDNMRDRNEKGRQAKGERVNHSKLTAENVRHIRELAEFGFKQTWIARLYQVTQANISAVVSGKTWRHV